MGGTTRKNQGSSELRRRNQRAILLLVRQNGRISRIAIARALRLSPAAVTKNTGPLLERGLLREVGLDETAAPTPVSGRPPMLLALAPEYAYVGGIDLSGDPIRVGISDLDGRAVGATVSALRPEGPAATITPATLERATASLLELYASLGLPPGRLSAVCLGIPGIIDEADGTFRLSTRLPGQDAASLVAAIRRSTHADAYLRNDMNLALLAESRIGACRGVQSAILLYVGLGVGGALLIHGRMVSGHRGAAGELGLAPLSGSGAATLEEAVSFPAMVRRAAEAGVVPTDVGPKAFLEACRTDRRAREVLEAALRTTAAVLGGACALADPERIVVAGPLADAWDLAGPFLEARLREHCPLDIDLVPAALGADSVLAGAFETGIGFVVDKECGWPEGR